MRYKIGFYTSPHPKLDKIEIGQTILVLSTITCNAKSVFEAISKAKSKTDLPYLKSELPKRYPNAKFINYTYEHVGQHPSTWGRIFNSWRIIE